MKSRILLALVASTAMSSATLADNYDWTGVYGGVSGGVSGTNSGANVEYDNGTDRGWSNNGMFSSDTVVGDFYDTTRDPDWVSVNDWEHDSALSPKTDSEGSLDGNSGASSFDPVTPWLSMLEDDDLNGAGSARLGANLQFSYLVLGLEADGTLLFNETFVDSDISESASLSTSNSGLYNTDGEADNEFGYTCGYEDDCSYSTEYDASYSQDGDFGFRSSIDSLFTFRGRVGLSSGRALFFATGGLASGQIKMSTSAHTSEQSDSSWSGTASNADDSVSTVTDAGSSQTSENTSWDASKSETATGYAVGGGFSFAVTDNVILTSDGYYYDLGRHSITATDNFDDSSYTISQRFDGYVLRTGVEWKF